MPLTFGKAMAALVTVQWTVHVTSLVIGGDSPDARALVAAIEAAASFDPQICQPCHATGNSSGGGGSPFSVEPSPDGAHDGAHRFGFTSHSREVLYRLRLHRPTEVNVSTCHNSFNTVIYLFSRENITADSRPLFINDDTHFDVRDSIAARPNCHPTASVMSVRLPAGRYVIAIEGFEGEHGAFDLRVDMREEPQSLQEALAAAPVTTVGQDPGEGTTTATFHGNTDTGQHQLARTSAEAREVFYRLDLQAQHQINISTCENELDTVLYVFSADDWTAVSDAWPLYLNDDLTLDFRTNLAARPGCHRSSSFLSLNLAPGSYWVVVEGFDEYHGAFDLTFDWQWSAPESLADALAFAPRFGPAHSATTHFDSLCPASTVADMVWWAGYAGDIARGSRFLSSALLAGRDVHDDDAQNDPDGHIGGSAHAVTGGMEIYRLDLDHPDVPHYELNLRTCESPEVDVVLMIYDDTIDEPSSFPIHISRDHTGDSRHGSCSETSSFLSASLAPGVYYVVVVGATSGGSGVYDLIIDARLDSTLAPPATTTQPADNYVELDLDLGSGSGSGPDEDYPVTSRTPAITTVGNDNAESTIPTVGTTAQATLVSTRQSAANDGTSASDNIGSTGIPGSGSSSSSVDEHRDSYFMLVCILILGVALVASGAAIKHQARSRKHFQDHGHRHGTHKTDRPPVFVNSMYASVNTMKIQRVTDIDIHETGPGFSIYPNPEAANHPDAKPDHVSLLVPDTTEGYSSA